LELGFGLEKPFQKMENGFAKQKNQDEVGDEHQVKDAAIDVARKAILI
jgi:hypothetical protein